MQSIESSDLAGRSSWRDSLLAPGVWRRGALYGLPAGLIQAALNQGDYWLAGHITTSVAVKSVVSPLVGFGVAYLAAVTTHHETHRSKPVPEGIRATTTEDEHGIS